MSSHSAPKRKPRAAHSATTLGRFGRARVFVHGLLYLIALSLLVVWEYRDHLSVFSSDCELRDQVKSSFYNLPYEQFLDRASSGAAGHVVTLAIPIDLEEIQKNLCLGREYMSDVLHALAPQNTSVVVIDKFYSAGTCTSAPSSTQDLLQAVAALKVPVVIGESTNGLEHQVGGSCLVRKPQLDFGSSNVKHGLIRINSEPERIPLRWLVLPTRNTPQAEFTDTLSFAAIKAYDPDFAAQHKIQQMALHDDHAYANLAINTPRITTTQLLCSTSDDHLRKKWSLDCSAQPALPNLTGKVIVIGSETASDQKLVLGQHIWGFELQARYIEALLSGDYLGFLPIWWGLVVFALFIFLIEGLPTILIARRPHWKRLPLLHYAYPHRRYVWVALSAVITIVVSALVLLALRYLPPLLVYGDILFIAVTRLLIFLAESAEHPFVHAHRQKKEHIIMSTPRDLQEDPSTNSIDPAQTPEEPEALEEAVEPAERPSSNRPGSEGGTEG